MVVSVNVDKCVGCRTCELACSFYNKGVFCPDESQVRICFTEKGELAIEVLDKCKCSGHEIPLCIEFCPTDAITINC